MADGGGIGQIGTPRVDISEDAENRWAAPMEEKAIDRKRFLIDCMPGYYNRVGAVKRSFLNELFGGGAFDYSEILQKWRENGFDEDTEARRG